MKRTTFRMPARRLASVATATALAAGPAALAVAGPAHATERQGRASAVVLRTGLDVSLLNKTVQLPLAVSLNEVQAPASADKAALTATLDGVDDGKPFSVLAAEVAESRATVDDTTAEASTRLAHARLHVPGLPLLSLVEIGAVTSKAVCETGKAPTAEASLVGPVTVLGKKISVSVTGPVEVKVPGVGGVRLDLSKRETTTRTAAATALELAVTVNPLNLNVAEVHGTVTLAKATCETPQGAAAEGTPSTPPADAKPQGSAGDPAEPSVEATPAAAKSQADGSLAETGSNSTTPYLAAGAVALLAVGGGAVALARRKRG